MADIASRHLAEQVDNIRARAQAHDGRMHRFLDSLTSHVRERGELLPRINIEMMISAIKNCRAKPNYATKSEMILDAALWYISEEYCTIARDAGIPLCMGDIIADLRGFCDVLTIE